MSALSLVLVLLVLQGLRIALALAGGLGTLIALLAMIAVILSWLMDPAGWPF